MEVSNVVTSDQTAKKVEKVSLSAKVQTYENRACHLSLAGCRVLYKQLPDCVLNALRSLVVMCMGIVRKMGRWLYDCCREYRNQLIDSPFSGLVVPELLWATIRAKSRTTFVGISSHMRERV